MLYKEELSNPQYQEHVANHQFSNIGKELFPALASEGGCVVLKITKQQCASSNNPSCVDRVYTVDYQHITDAEYLETLTRHSSHEAIKGYYPDREVK
jgi:hypothetical protein